MAEFYNGNNELKVVTRGDQILVCNLSGASAPCTVKQVMAGGHKLGDQTRSLQFYEEWSAKRRIESGTITVKVGNNTMELRMTSGNAELVPEPAPEPTPKQARRRRKTATITA